MQSSGLFRLIMVMFLLAASSCDKVNFEATPGQNARPEKNAGASGDAKRENIDEDDDAEKAVVELPQEVAGMFLVCNMLFVEEEYDSAKYGCMVTPDNQAKLPIPLDAIEFRAMQNDKEIYADFVIQAHSSEYHVVFDIVRNLVSGTNVQTRVRTKSGYGFLASDELILEDSVVAENNDSPFLLEFAGDRGSFHLVVQDCRCD